uniref:Uncharacterized protein n=1 Tax=Glossina pallidipes TaxID=7398 RepID=A0A1B0AIL7_GLOPL
MKGLPCADRFLFNYISMGSIIIPTLRNSNGTNSAAPLLVQYSMDEFMSQRCMHVLNTYVKSIMGLGYSLTSSVFLSTFCIMRRRHRTYHLFACICAGAPLLLSTSGGRKIA